MSLSGPSTSAGATMALMMTGEDNHRIQRMSYLSRLTGAAVAPQRVCQKVATAMPAYGHHSSMHWQQLRPLSSPLWPLDGPSPPSTPFPPLPSTTSATPSVAAILSTCGHPLACGPAALRPPCAAATCHTAAAPIGTLAQRQAEYMRHSAVSYNAISAAKFVGLRADLRPRCLGPQRGVPESPLDFGRHILSHGTASGVGYAIVVPFAVDSSYSSSSSGVRVIPSFVLALLA